MAQQMVLDRECYNGAAALMAEFGLGALAEAAARAGRSRDLGNHIHYTLWCRVGRTILLLEDPDFASTVH